MLIYKIVPDGWPCALEEMRPGAFVYKYTWKGESKMLLFFKSEYHTPSNNMEVFNEAGEYASVEASEVVQPVRMEAVVVHH